MATARTFCKPTSPTAWHRFANRDETTCSLCGLNRETSRYPGSKPSYTHQMHRARRDGDPDDVRWLVRGAVNSVRAIKQQAGGLVEELLTSEQNRERIRQVVARVLLGVSRRDIAKALGIKADSLREFLSRHAATFDAELAQVGREGAAAVIEPITQRGPIPLDVQRLVVQAAALVASGKTEPEVADLLELSPGTITHWRDRYRDFWHSEVKRAVAVAQSLQKHLAGTLDALDHPDRFMAQARVCERVLPAIVVEVPLSDEMTLSELYECYYKPAKLKDAAKQTLTTYNSVVRKWKAFTGDPPLRDISVRTLMGFRDAVERLAGQDGGLRSDWSVAQNIKHIQYILDRAAPPGHRHRDGLGLLKQVPYLKPPRVCPQLPRPVPNNVLDQIYRAADKMVRPRIDGIAPAAWWRCLLVIALNSGLRSETLFTFCWEHVLLEEGRLEIPAEFMKTRMPIILPLNSVAIDHLRSIRGEAGRVFAWPHGRKAFYDDWHRLHDQAGIPRMQHYKLKQIRKSLATLLWESDPAAAQLALGHTTDKTTRTYYVSRHLIQRAMQTLPQPAAFTEGMASLAVAAPSQ